MKNALFKHGSMLVFTLIASMVLFYGVSEAKKTVVLKMASAATGRWPADERIFVDRFNQLANGAYKIEYYPSEQMVKFPELLDAIRTGAADLGYLTPNAFSFNEPKLAAVELPFLFNNVQANAYAAPLIQPLYNEILEKKFNQKLLCLHHYTGLELFSTKPIKTLEDWKGLLVQSLSPTCTSVISAMGAAPVAIAYTESYQSLEKNVVDAVLTAPGAASVFKLAEVAPYLSRAYYISASHGISINSKVWKKMPQNIQAIMLDEAEKASKIISDKEMNFFEEEIAGLASAGVQVYTVPNAERDRWKETVQSYIDKQLSTMGDIGQKVLAIAQEANSKFP